MAYWLDLAELSSNMADLSCRGRGSELWFLKVQKKTYESPVFLVLQVVTHGRH